MDVSKVKDDIKDMNRDHIQSSYIKDIFWVKDDIMDINRDHIQNSYIKDIFWVKGAIKDINSYNTNNSLTVIPGHILSKGWQKGHYLDHI